MNYVIVGKLVQIICIKEYTNSHFSPYFFLNLNSSFNINSRLLKFSMVIIDIMMQGTMSQIFYFGPSFCFM